MSYHLLHEFVLVAGIVLTVLILLLLSKKQSGLLHQKLLRGFFITIFLLFLFHYSAYHKIAGVYHITNALTNGIGFLIGPLIYGYIVSLFTDLKHHRPRFWLYFLPYLLYTLIFSIPFALSNPLDGLIIPYIGTYIDHVDIFVLIENFFLLGFTVWSLVVLVENKEVIGYFFSNVSSLDILWSQRLLLCLVFYLSIDFLLMMIEVFVEEFHHFAIYLNVLLMLLITIYLGYYGFFQSQILIPSFLLNPSANLSNRSVSKKAIATFSKKEQVEIETAVYQVLNNEQLYLNPTLTLSDLAQAIRLTDKKLSTFINQELDTNFYELVNNYRINAFQAAIQTAENQHLTIWGIANKCGFNSKTSFNRIFKKRMKMTPSQYQKALNLPK
ncbi:MAG: helix-turn-helix transcriptional regulator [Bacteroidota bacterium]